MHAEPESLLEKVTITKYWLKIEKALENVHNKEQYYEPTSSSSSATEIKTIKIKKKKNSS
jgi:hypothetical protein